MCMLADSLGWGRRAAVEAALCPHTFRAWIRDLSASWQCEGYVAWSPQAGRPHTSMALRPAVVNAVGVECRRPRAVRGRGGSKAG